MTQVASSRSHSRRPAKDGRIALRASQDERDLIERASAASDTTVSAFVLQASLALAQDVLGERRVFVLPPDRWNAFVEMLDRSPADLAAAKPRLRRLLTEPSVLER